MDANRSGGANGSEPCTVVLFGASGDLAKRKVIPAMFDLASHSSLGPRYAIVGFARTPMNDESFRASLGEAAKSMSEVGPIDPKKWEEFASNLHYQPGEYGKAEDFANLAKRLKELEVRKKAGRQPAVLSFHASRSVQGHRRAAWQGGARAADVSQFLGAHHH